MPRKMPIEADANLRKAREAALLAVETYNRPGASFRTAGFLVLMVVAWTALFHAIFAKRKVKPYYRQKKRNRLHRHVGRHRPALPAEQQFCLPGLSTGFKLDD